jgi:hypothetical protein
MSDFGDRQWMGLMTMHHKGRWTSYHYTFLPLTQMFKPITIRLFKTIHTNLAWLSHIHWIIKDIANQDTKRHRSYYWMNERTNERTNKLGVGTINSKSHSLSYSVSQSATEVHSYISCVLKCYRPSKYSTTNASTSWQPIPAPADNQYQLKSNHTKYCKNNC